MSFKMSSISATFRVSRRKQSSSLGLSQNNHEVDGRSRPLPTLSDSCPRRISLEPLFEPSMRLVVTVPVFIVALVAILVVANLLRSFEFLQFKAAEKEQTSRFLNAPVTKDNIAQIMPSLVQDNSTVVVSYTGSAELDPLCWDFFEGTLCDRIKGIYQNLTDYNNHSTLINISFSCQLLFDKPGMGSGNFLSGFYGMRLLAQALGTTDVSIQCNDAQETKKNLILPWVMGIFPQVRGDETARSIKEEELPPLEQACTKTWDSIGYRLRDIQYEMRKMAIAMVGIPHAKHPSAAWARENLWSSVDDDHFSPHRHGRYYYQLPAPQKGDLPLFPDTELDDAMLHFRCGDLIYTDHQSFGFMKFGSFSRHLSPHVRTIGIATQPFGRDGNRAMDQTEVDGVSKTKRCKQVVMAFQKHLQRTFPAARIRVHNGVNETIALTFARMIMANQTVVAISTFGVFPAVSTFGTSYIRKPDYPRAPNWWLVNSPAVQKAENIELVEEPRLMARRVKRMWGANGAAVIGWMENYAQ